jgi:hypothetical protein
VVSKSARRNIAPVSVMLNEWDVEAGFRSLSLDTPHRQVGKMWSRNGLYFTRMRLRGDSAAVASQFFAGPRVSGRHPKQRRWRRRHTLIGSDGNCMQP